MILAVDFDGTIVDDNYPKIGKEKLFAFEALISLQKQGHQIILWTVRGGIELEEAVNFCKKKGLIFYAINKNYPEEITGANPRKLNASVFIDDKSLEELKPWGEIHQQLSEIKSPLLKKKSNWWNFFKD